jgi:hypothetical protein
MEQVSISMSTLQSRFGQLASRRSILQGAAAAAAAIAAAPFASPVAAFADDGESEHDDVTVLKFSTMAGIHAPFLGDAGLAAFRGVHGGGAPWVISEGVGSLRSDGRLRVRVRGLVLDPAFVPAPNGGTNPIPFFMAIVSGFSTDPVNPVNLATTTFPATKTGNADISAMLTLPHPFYAPIVFVTSLPLGTPAAPRWFAVTGRQ